MCVPKAGKMYFLPEKNTDYANIRYWNERYLTEINYEWFKGYSDFKHIISSAIETDSEILVLGCGNSRLSEDMHSDGFVNIVNVDYSQVVIDKMREQCQSIAPQMEWLVMDITRDFDFQPQSFDVVIEKGTLDAMLVGEKDPWRISPDNERLIENILNQVSRVLKPGGRFLSITFAQPHFRKKLYAKAKYNWSFKYVEFGESFAYFVYTMVKGERLSPEDLQKSSTSTSTTTTAASCVTSEQENGDFLNKICI